MIDTGMLQFLDKKELREVAKNMGIKIAPAEKPESIIAKITIAKQIAQPDKKEAAPKPMPKPNATKEQIQAEAAKYPGVELSFIDDDTWHIKRGVAEDSGTIHQPIHVIINKIQVMKQAKLPRVDSGLLIGF